MNAPSPARMPQKAAWAPTAAPAPVQGPPTRLVWRSSTPQPLTAPRPGGHTQRFLSAVVDDSPCDGSHGRFCPECASINRWSTK